MDYDDIDDYDEDYNIRDIDNNWLNRNMDYNETDSDSNDDIDDYNYNSNTKYNNWNISKEYKTNRHTNRHDNNLLELVNNKLKNL